MATIKERLDRALAHAGLTQTEVERRAELTKGYLSRPLAGTRKRLDPGALAAIARVCGVRVDWLISGTGSMAAGDDETHVDRTDAQPVPSDDDGFSALDAAIRAADAGRNERWVFDLARRASTTIHMQVLEGQSLESVARDLLAAAKRLGKDAKPGVVAQQALVGLRQPPHDRRV